MDPIDLSSMTPGEILKTITSSSCLVLIYKNGCGACEIFKPVFAQASQMASLIANFYLIGEHSPGIQVAEHLIKKFNNQEIEGFPTTLIMCEICSDKKSQLVDVLVGTRHLDHLINRAIEICPPMKK